MEPEESSPILKKIRMSQLEPKLQEEITELALELGNESTIESTSNLHFLFELYQVERKREKQDLKILKKAQDMILRLSSLHHDIQQRENRRRGEETKKRIHPPMSVGSISASTKTLELLASIGITDKDIADKAEGLLGESGVENRVEVLKISILGDKLVKKVFGTHPELILIPKDKDFESEVEAMESKKFLLDEWSKANEKPLPLWLDYEQSPGILVDTFEELNRQLKLQPPEETLKEKKDVKYVSRPMKTREMMSVLPELGFEFKRKVKELVFEGEGGRMLTISDPHDGEYDAVTVRKIIRDIGVVPSEFEEARRRSQGKA